MSIKHRKGRDTEYKRKENNYQNSNHLHKNYPKTIQQMNYAEILSEYNKIRLILQMMRHTGRGSIKPYPDRQTRQDNIRVIKYKYNIICQEITKRGYQIMQKDYRKHNVRYSR